jgi:phosphatidylinositol alpha-mannosyltransferase
MRVGLVSPYPWDVPGGVVAHVRDLAESLIALGHEVSVITPVDDEATLLPDYVVRAGRTVPVPYNGSVARLVFGPVSATRMHRWLRDGNFDVLHLHSPETFSLSLVALLSARGPIVATFHSANPRSRILSLLQSPLQPQMEKVQARIAVSPAARRTIVEHLGGDAVIIPNGVVTSRFRHARPLPGWPAPGGSVGFLGRLDEPRKGLAVLLAALPRLVEDHPDLRVAIAGPGDPDFVAGLLPAGLGGHVELLGALSEADKPRFYASVDVFVAPNTGGESFGIVLLEAMAARTPIVASDLDAFRAVLDAGSGARLVPVGDPAELATAVDGLLDDPPARAALARRASELVAPYDWRIVAAEIVGVYEMVAVGGVPVSPEEAEIPDGVLPGGLGRC